MSEEEKRNYEMDEDIMSAGDYSDADNKQQEAAQNSQDEDAKSQNEEAWVRSKYSQFQGGQFSHNYEIEGFYTQHEQQVKIDENITDEVKQRKKQIDGDKIKLIERLYSHYDKMIEETITKNNKSIYEELKLFLSETSRRLEEALSNGRDGHSIME